MNEGLKQYPWLKVESVTPVPQDGWYINSDGLLSHRTAAGCTDYCWPIVSPNNAYGVYRLEDIPIPEGWEADGETLAEAFRLPDTKFWLSCSGDTSYVERGLPCGGDYRRLCVREVKPKTRRVLVVEFEEPTDAVVKYWRDEMISMSKMAVRVEERPLEAK